MSLQKQTVSVPLIDGISEQDDAFAHDPPGFIELAEVRWNRDKQMGKRFGVSDRVGKGGALPLAPASVKGANAIVDLDGVPHILSADGTARRVPDGGATAWNRLSRCAPRPGRVVVDPVVRMNGSSVKPDVALAGDIACVVWEQVDQNSDNAGAYYQFFDVSEDVPRPLCPITALPTIVCSPRVVVISSRYFVATGISATTGVRFLYGCPYDTNASDYTFGAAVAIDAVTSGSNLYALAPSYSGAFCFVSSYTGATNYFVAKLDETVATLASKNLGAGGLGTPSQVLHNGPQSKVAVIQTDGTIKHVADSLSGAVTTVTPFSAPASGAYAGKWTRAAIGLSSAAGAMIALRSTSAVGALGEPVGTQILQLSTGFVATKEKLIGGVCLAGLCSPFFTPTARSYFALTGPQAWYTGDYDPTVGASVNGALRAEPYALICQAVDASSELQVATVARVGHDRIDLLGNAVVGVANVATAGTAVSLSSLALDPAALRGDTRFLMAYPARLGDVTGSWGLKRGVDLASVQVIDATPARNVSAQSLRIVGTSHGTSAIDGVMHAEMTPQPPEWVQVSGSDAASPGNSYSSGAGSHIDTTGSPWGGGANPNRQWGFVVVWRYVDQHGNVHRSAPSSIAYTLLSSLVDGSGNGGKLLFFDWKAHALQGDVGLTPEVEVYGCPYDGGGDFRLLGIVTPKADTTMEGRVFVTLVHGGTMVSNGVELNVWDNGVTGIAGLAPVPRSLYTTEAGGSELPSSVSPALLSICSTQSRLWGLSAEDRLDVWYTKPIALGFAPEWSDTLRVRVPQDGGQAVAIAAIDDKVIVFKRSRIFMIEGEGGDASGNGSSLRTPRLISSDVGCDSVESVVEGPFGIVFHSQRGFMVLSRDLAYQFVGDKVIDQLTTDNGDDEPRRVVSACLVPAEAEVRFCLDTANRVDAGGWLRGLVWNYRFGRWCRRDALAASFNALVGDDEWWMVEGVTAGGSNAVYQETPRVWTSSAFGIACKTSWIKLNGIAGFARMRRATFVFRWYRGGIRILTAQDYRDATETARDWTEAEIGALTSAGELLELVVHPLVQRCEAVQFQIVELGAAGGAAESGRAFELVGVTLECGVYPGAFRKLGTGARK